jgi:hypothetical protein
MLLNRAHHVGDPSVPDVQRFHKVFRQVVQDFEQRGETLTNKETILHVHQAAYNRWGQSMDWGKNFGDKVRAVQEAWLRSKGYYP